MPSRMAEAMELQLCTWQEMPRVSCNGTTGCCKGIVVIRVVHEVSVAHRHQRACRARGRAPESVGHNPGAYAFLLSHFRVLTRITSFRSIHASHPTNQLHQQPAAASPTYPITSHRRTSLLQFTLTSHPHHATLSILLISFGFWVWWKGYWLGRRGWGVARVNLWPSRYIFFSCCIWWHLKVCACHRGSFCLCIFESPYPY